MAEIQIPGVDFTALAREAIAHEITKALVKSDESVSAIVTAALTRKVDSKGSISQYNSDNTIPYVQWIAENLIRSAVQKSLQERIAELKPQIEVAVSKGLKASSGTIAQMLVDGFTKQAATAQYAIAVQVDAKQRY